MNKPTINFVYFWPDINMRDMLDQTAFHPRHDVFWKKFLSMLLDNLTVDYEVKYTNTPDNPYQFNIMMLSIIPNPKPNIKWVHWRNTTASNIPHLMPYQLYTTIEHLNWFNE